MIGKVKCGSRLLLDGFTDSAFDMKAVARWRYNDLNFFPSSMQIRKSFEILDRDWMNEGLASMCWYRRVTGIDRKIVRKLRTAKIMSQKICRGG